MARGQQGGWREARAERPLPGLGVRSARARLGSPCLLHRARRPRGPWPGRSFSQRTALASVTQPVSQARPYLPPSSETQLETPPGALALLGTPVWAWVGGAGGKQTCPVGRQPGRLAQGPVGCVLALWGGVGTGLSTFLLGSQPRRQPRKAAGPRPAWQCSRKPGALGFGWEQGMRVKLESSSRPRSAEGPV